MSSSKKVQYCIEVVRVTQTRLSAVVLWIPTLDSMERQRFSQLLEAEEDLQKKAMDTLTTGAESGQVR